MLVCMCVLFSNVGLGANLFLTLGALLFCGGIHVCTILHFLFGGIHVCNFFQISLIGGIFIYYICVIFVQF